MEMFMIFIGVALLLLTIPTATTFTESFNKKRNIIVGIICGLSKGCVRGMYAKLRI